MSRAAIIAGSGRSGTTWVLDAVADANRMRTVFEPLHPVGVPQAEQFAYRYMRPDDEDPVFSEFMESVLSGRMKSLWTNYRIRPDRFNPLRNSPISVYLHVKKSVGLIRRFRSKRKFPGYVVKFIRANLMLPWIVRHYGIPSVLVLRHPCAVIASRMKLSGRDWGAQKALGHYRNNRSVCDLIMREFALNLNEGMSEVSALACVWCIENVLPLRWSKDEGYGVVSYEKLLVNPETEWSRLIQYLGLHNVPEKSLISAPSQQASAEMRDSAFSPQHLDSWKSLLTDSDLSDVAAMLERFGCDFYTIENPMPVQTSVRHDGEVT